MKRDGRPCTQKTEAAHWRGVSDRMWPTRHSNVCSDTPTVSWVSGWDRIECVQTGDSLSDHLLGREVYRRYQFKSLSWATDEARTQQWDMTRKTHCGA